MDLIESFAQNIAEVGDLPHDKANRIAREMISRRWVTPEQVRSIVARRRYLDLLSNGVCAEDARIEIEVTFELSESVSRMLIYRRKELG